MNKKELKESVVAKIYIQLIQMSKFSGAVNIHFLFFMYYLTSPASNDTHRFSFKFDELMNESVILIKS